MSRKGQLQISFHTVFALVGGFLFLLFFFFLIKNVILSEDSRDTRQLSFAVEATIKTAATTPNSFNVISLQDANYRFICDLDGARESYVRIDDNSYPDLTLFDHIPLFAPRSVQGDKFFTLTKTWNAPLPIGSFVYLSNNRTRYVLVGGMSDVADLKRFIEDEQLSGYDFLVTADPEGLNDEGHNRYRFVFFDGAPDGSTLKAELMTKDDSAIEVELYGNERGTITFYDELSPGLTPPSAGSEDYVGNEMLIAAIFSEDLETFRCNMQKATERLNTTLEILKRRADALHAIATTTECQNALTEGEGLLENYQNDLRGAFQYSSTLINRLEAVNSKLAVNDCPALY